MPLSPQYTLQHEYLHSIGDILPIDLRSVRGPMKVVANTFVDFTYAAIHKILMEVKKCFSYFMKREPEVIPSAEIRLCEEWTHIC